MQGIGQTIQDEFEDTRKDYEKVYNNDSQDRIAKQETIDLL